MEATTSAGAVIDADRLALLEKQQSEDMARMYCEVLTEVVTFIALADDPELSDDLKLHWMKTLAMIRKDITTHNSII